MAFEPPPRLAQTSKKAITRNKYVKINKIIMRRIIKIIIIIK